MKNAFAAHSYKILSLVLAIAMIFSMLPITAFAEAEPDDNIYATSGVTISGTDEEETPKPPAAYSIVAFAALADSVAMQTVTVDATRADLTLPESLDATVSNVENADGEAETEESIGGITWQSEPEFEAVTVGALELIPAGTYVFTPTLPQGYALADGVTLPVITVEVEPMGIEAAWSATMTANTFAELQARIGDFNNDATANTTITVTGTIDCTALLSITNTTHTLTITGGTLLRDVAGHLITVGGGQVASKAELTLDGITIDGGNRNDGAGTLVLVSNYSTFNMKNDAVLQNNNNTASGGGVYVGADSTFNMNGGTISGNTANNGGGVHNANGTFNVGTDEVIITGNTTTGGADNNVYLTTGKTIGLTGKLNTATRIGVTTATTPTAETPVTITSGTGSAIKENFISDNAAYETVLDGVIKLQVKSPPAPETTHEVHNITQLNDAIAAFNKSENKDNMTIKVGTSFATADTAITAINNTNTPAQTLTITSHGETRTLTRGKTGNLFTVTKGELILEDIIIDGNKGVAPYNTDGGGSLVRVNTGTFTLQDGAVLQNNKTNNGSGVYVSFNGTFNMNGTAKITGNKATNGTGGVFVDGNMYTTGIFNMSGGTITDNTSSVGGGVEVNGGTFTMSGSAVIGGSGDAGNTAANGGGVLVVVGGTFTMEGGTITGNTSTESGGGGVRVGGGTFTMEGGTITDNTSSGGGGVYVNYSMDNASIFNMKGGTIGGNTATGSGGGVYVGGTFNMTGGTISGNTASYNGGGVYVTTLNSTFNISGSPTIIGNKVGAGEEDTGGVYLYNKTITITNGPLTGAAGSIGIEGMATTAAGTTIATGAVLGDLAKFKISNATDNKIGGISELVFNDANNTITLGSVKPKPSAPSAPPAAGITVTDKTVTLVADSTMQFSKDGTNWQDSNVFDNLAPNTNYTFYQRLKETDTHTASDKSPGLTVTTEKSALTGKPTITFDGGGDINIGTQLGYEVSALNNASNLAVQWYRDGVAIGGATANVYTVTGADAGKTITVTVTADAGGDYTGSVTSDPTSTVNYTIIVPDISDSGDTVSGGTVYSSSTIDIVYTIATRKIENKLVLKVGETVIATLTDSDTSPYTYTVNAAHAVDGEITITATFSHADVLTTVGGSTVTAPEKGETPQITIPDNGNYSGTVKWNPADSKFKGDTAYTAEVTLTGKNGATFDSGFTPDVTDGTLGTVTVSPDGSTVTYTITYPKTDEKTATDIDVTTPPTNTIYYAGDKLDVTGLVVTATYDDGTTGTVTPDKYYIDGVEVVPGVTVLTTAHDGKTITVEYGGKTEAVGTVTMYSPLSAQIYITGLTDTSANITYSASGGSGTVETKLQVKKSGVWTDVANTSTQDTYTISNLASNTSYEFRVVVRDTGTGREYTKPVTFKTAQDSPSGITVEGEIEDGTAPAKILVTLENGNTVIASTQAAQKGSTAYYDFSFTKVPDGVYNLVVDNGSWKVTQAVTIVNGTIINPVNGTIEIDMASGRTQSVVEIVNADTPPASVGGLPELFQDNTIYTPADATHVSGGGTVEIKLAVEKIDSPADANLIANAASGQAVGLYLDLSVIKSRIDSTGALLNETKLSDLNRNLITITFELPDGLKGKKNLTIYRVHGGIAQALPFAPNTNADGENADISGDIVTLNVCKFSTYAIAYTSSSPNPPSPPTSPSSKGGSSSGGGGSSPDGRTGADSTPPTQWVDESDTKTLVKSATGQGADSVRTSSSGKAGIRKKALQTLGKSGLTYRHDTVADGAVRVRVYVDDPSAATKDILASGYTSGANVDKMTAIINKWFSNDAAVLSFDQQGDFGMNVRIAALANLSGLDTSNLYFYSYDKATNKYKLIVTEYRIDSKGYVHFSTVLAGSIIITDSPLTKIGADAEEDAEAYDPPMTGGSLDNPTTGGDGIGMYIPPAKAQPQDFTAADSIVEAVAADGVLKLESNLVPAAIAGNAAGNVNNGGVLKINLDAPNVLDTAQESGKPSVGMIAGIAIALFFVSMILWAVVPRKNDMLLQDDER